MAAKRKRGKMVGSPREASSKAKRKQSDRVAITNSLERKENVNPQLRQSNLDVFTRTRDDGTVLTAEQIMENELVV
uniref:Der GTPase-activating protein YihI n=1 Tax=Rhabditophanes sp. KR3021 TaxID=114890 RepID=A0AC35UBU0_9BILA